MRIAVLCLALLAAACLDTPVDTTGIPTHGPVAPANPITGLTMRYVAVDLVVGETTYLGYTPQLSNKGAFIPLVFRWWSSAPEVATVDPNGLVSALSPGRAFVTLTIDGYVGETTVTVREPPPPGR